MSKVVFPLIVFVLGLFIADYFFGLDTRDLFEGFGDFLVNLFSGGRR